jgi:hypothetical protein
MAKSGGETLSAALRAAASGHWVIVMTVAFLSRLVAHAAAQQRGEDGERDRVLDPFGQPLTAARAAGVFRAGGTDFRPFLLAHGRVWPVTG